MGLAGRARAAEPVRLPVRLELAACLDDHDAIARAVRVELGDDAIAEADGRAIGVGVTCAADGVDAGIVVEVRPPDSPRRYRYALDWHAQPADTRPRLVGLAVAEAVDASRIELTAVPEPAVVTAAVPAVAPPPPPSAWTLALVGSRRAFSAPTGVDLLGGGLAPSVRLSPHWRLAGDLLGEGATALTRSGAVSVLSLSSAPRLVAHTGDRRYAELGVGARVGVALFTGQAIPGSDLAGRRLVRPWLGPAARLEVGAALTPTISLRASVEAGVVATGATALDFGTPAAAVDGRWTAIDVAAAFTL